MSAACTAPHCSRELRAHETAAAQQLCDLCIHRARAILASIPAALVVLHGSLQRERSGDTGRAGTREAPLPCRADVLNLVGPAASGTVHDPHGDQIGQQPIAGVLGSWVRLVCEERRINGPIRYRVEDLASWLSNQLGFAATKPWGAELVSELNDLMWQIRGIARIEIRTRAISRPCPRCQLMALSRTDHDMYTRCSGCGSSWTDAELNADAVTRNAA
ncbi:hypothetical protein [Streptomyces capitiformicae]|uniref:Uncharacterized protein n=1 Tax=Streptomyces capitiformicae TaxID=2014920 RepID=A0A919L907_9ACTN|nr:hypothetical protein [Streptomyces capitiformicae]GHH87879.1 hypothetical protein GCM10017771_30870 [Streptomyces capitiformicae]